MKTFIQNKLVTLVIVLAASLLFILLGSKLSGYSPAVAQDEKLCTAKVVSVGASEEEYYSDNLASKRITFTATLTSGVMKGETQQMLQHMDYMYAVQPREVKAGDTILVRFEIDDKTSQGTWMFAEHNRSDGLFWLCLLFLVLVVVTGGIKGLRTIASLLLTAGAVFLVYIPSILGGRNIYATTVVVTLFIIVMSLVTINGWNRKTLCAVLGNAGGVLVAALVALAANSLFHITGFIDQDYVFLTLSEGGAGLDLRAMVWGGIVIGSLGAIMDVAMSIASAMDEIAFVSNNRSTADMVASGMNIGRDAIGTMTNTLILAYIGSSLATVLLLTAHNSNLLYLFNMEMIVVEVLQAIIGSMGILFAVPVTVVVAAYLYRK